MKRSGLVSLERTAAIILLRCSGVTRSMNQCPKGVVAIPPDWTERGYSWPDGGLAILRIPFLSENSTSHRLRPPTPMVEAVTEMIVACQLPLLRQLPVLQRGLSGSVALDPSQQVAEDVADR